MRNILILIFIFYSVFVFGQIDNRILQFYSSAQFDSVLIYHYKRSLITSDDEPKWDLILGDSYHHTGNYFEAFLYYSQFNRNKNLSKEDKKHVKEKIDLQNKTYKKIEQEFQPLKAALDKMDVQNLEKELLNLVEKYPRAISLIESLIEFNVLDEGNEVEILRLYDQYKLENAYNQKLVESIIFYLKGLKDKQSLFIFLNEIKNDFPRQYHNEQYELAWNTRNFKSALLHFTALSEDTVSASFALKKVDFIQKIDGEESAIKYLLNKKLNKLEVAEKLADLYYNIEDYNSALEYYNLLMNEDSSFDYFISRAASCKGYLVKEKFGRDGNIEAAILYEKAANLKKDDPSYFYNAALYYNRTLSERLKSIVLAEKAVQLIAKNEEKYSKYNYYDYLYLLTNCYEFQDERNKIWKVHIPEFKRRYEKDSTNADKAYYLGLIIDHSVLCEPTIETEKISNIAIRYLKRAIQLDSTQMDYFNALDQVYLTNFSNDTKHDSERIDLALRQIRLFPANLEGYATMFYVNFWKKNYTEANKWYVKINAVENAVSGQWLRHNINLEVNSIRKFNWSKIKQVSDY